VPPKTVSIRIKDEELYKKVKIKAIEKGETVTQVIERAFQEYVK
jgi:prophage tail gpP-like protein